jgi:flagellar L-ring protein FlgH
MRVIFGKTYNLLILILICGGCSTMADKEYTPTPEEMTPVDIQPANGSIYQESTGMRLFEDERAHQVGDLLTVFLIENTDANKSASTSTSKKNEYGLNNPTIFGVPVDIGSPRAANLAMSMGSSQAFSGDGASSQRNSLQGSITVMVTRVMPGGNLVIQGEKVISLNQGEENLRLSGIIRQQDIQPGNSILSTKVANAHIKYGGKGPVASASIVGWLTRFFLAFSPF